MPEISIEDLAISVPFMSESQARQLALGIAQRLATTEVSAMEAEVPALRVDLTAGNGSDTGQLARQVVEEILRQIRRQS